MSKKKYVVVALWVDPKAHSASSSVIGIYKSKKKANKAAGEAEYHLANEDKGFMEFDHCEIKVAI
ncbi:MAG: hypothetical protein ACRDCE_11285 [Cetobacterium sp.]|uniref:hypothetical protein n=1 Tax=Cetobacterium sp. TaxID=2071632 RepID=UPI003EE6146C